MNHDDIRHVIGTAVLVVSVPIAPVALSERVRGVLWDLRADWMRRGYLTASERTQLREERRQRRACTPSQDLLDWRVMEGVEKRAKFRPDLLVGNTYPAPQLPELTAAQLISQFRHAVSQLRQAKTAHAPLTTSGCLDGFPLVRQWSEQVEALQAEFDRRSDTAVRRTLSWHERRTLSRGAFEIYDYEAYNLPLPLITARHSQDSVDSSDIGIAGEW
jgi:hypothetical protein